jgi:hypothetical protein
MDIADLWVTLTVIGFFGLCVAFVQGCDRIIGPDDASDLDLDLDDVEVDSKSFVGSEHGQ